MSTSLIKISMLFSHMYQKGEHIIDVYFRSLPKNLQAPATDVFL